MGKGMQGRLAWEACKACYVSPRYQPLGPVRQTSLTGSVAEKRARAMSLCCAAASSASIWGCRVQWWWTNAMVIHISTRVNSQQCVRWVSS